MKSILFFFLFVAASFSSAVVYRSNSCGHCTPYLEEVIPFLQERGYGDIQISDYMSDTDARKEMFEIQERFNVPLSMQGHMIILLDDKFLFEGHVPMELMEGYLSSPDGQIVITQDKMDSPTFYDVLKDGNQYRCPIDSSIDECIAGAMVNETNNPDWPFGSIIPIALLVAAIGFIGYSWL